MTGLMGKEDVILLKEIRLKNGEVLKDVFIDYQSAVWFPGFFPARRDGDIVYIALDNIASFTVVGSEKECVYGLVSMSKPR